MATVSAETFSNEVFHRSQAIEEESYRPTWDQVQNAVSFLAAEDGDEDPTTLNLDYYLNENPGLFRKIADGFSVNIAGVHPKKGRQVIEALAASGIDSERYMVAIGVGHPVHPVADIVIKTLFSYQKPNTPSQEEAIVADVASSEQILAELNQLRLVLGTLSNIAAVHEDSVVEGMLQRMLFSVEEVAVQVRSGHVAEARQFIQRVFSAKVIHLMSEAPYFDNYSVLLEEGEGRWMTTREWIRLWGNIHRQLENQLGVVREGVKRGHSAAATAVIPLARAARAVGVSAMAGGRGLLGIGRGAGPGTGTVVSCVGFVVIGTGAALIFSSDSDKDGTNSSPP